MQDIRIAAVVFNALLGDIEGNLRRMESMCIEAADNDAELICFPELSITGYSAGEAIIPFALSLDDPRLDSLKLISRNRSLTILAGMAEKDTQDRIFASHLVIIPGKPVSVYRKLHIAPPEAETFSGGTTIPIFEKNGFRFGIQLCYDAHFPFLSTHMAENNVDVIFMPHASPRGTSDDKFNSWMRHIPARAFDNGVFVIAMNQTGPNGNGLVFPGLALVVDPSGHVMGKDISGAETILYADLKKADLNHVRNHSMRYFLPNMRKDML